eukprot:SAG22_NODE_354_length_11811_cov_8.612620_5_plen_254_part_00
MPERVTPDNLADYVGKPVFNTTRMYETTPAGVVMGLAWTSMGGQVLYVEACPTGWGLGAEAAEATAGDGSGGGADGAAAAGGGGGGGQPRIKVTGQLGDVMSESIKIAQSYAQQFLQTESPGNRFLYDRDIHIHVPEGGTPKDGPSAGITMVTAMCSLALGRPVRQRTAMTGELSLTGMVLPIGGVKEKVIAARQSEVRWLILPEGNRKDWEELDSSLTDGFDVTFASRYEDVFAVCFPPPGEETEGPGASSR